MMAGDRSKLSAAGTGRRVPLVGPGTRPALAAIERDILAGRGRISPLYQVLLNSAPIAAGWEHLLTAVRSQTSLPADLRELVILRVAVLNRARYEFDAHVPHAERAGLGSEQIEGLRQPLPPAARYTAVQNLALALADAMTRDIEVPDALKAKLQAEFDATGLVELVATVAAYNMVSRLLVALHLGH
jgi:AhpD family alkylhydroperoxidase